MIIINKKKQCNNRKGMLRRRAAIHPRAAIIALGGPTRSFFDNLKKQLGAVTSSSNDGSTSNNNNNSNASSSSSGSSKAGDANTPSGFPPGFNAQQMQTLQQLFNSQPKEKQEQLLKQAMDMQRMLSKVPGMGKLAQKNMAMMEQMLKMQSGAAPSSEGSNTSASQSTASPNARRDLFRDAATGSASSKSRSGPSLDELKKVNLGPEIEALFEELRSIRSRKNEYREKYHTAQVALDGLREEHRDLVAREANVRSKLAKAEQEVMLLTSENMELRDNSKAVKQLSQTNKQLKQEVEQLKSAAQASAAPGTASYAALKQQYQASEDALRSLQRKVDRMRRRDPLLQFSLACSDVSRHCVAIRADESSAAAAAAGSPTSATGAAYSGGESAISEAGQEAAEQAFANLQSSYMQRQQEAWRTAAHEHGAAAKAYVAVVRRYVTTRVPHANYDAVVSFTGDLSALRAAFKSIGFNVEAIPGETNKVHVVAGADAGTLTEQPGPYGYAFALRLATASQARQANTSDHGSGTELGAAGFTVTTACPYVSSALVDNAKRSVVQYETARASGPGGQATNVTETQVYAKLSIDGVPAFTAEAQDSRSALSNKEAALDKLRQQRRQQYNETLAKQEKAEVVQAQLTAAMCRQGGLTVEAEVMQLVQEAAAANDVSAEDAALVAMLQELSRIAAMTA